jgi:hypothetical protein
LASLKHGPDVVNNFRDTLSLIDEVGSPHFKACMDINIEDDPESKGCTRRPFAVRQAGLRLGS